MGDSMTLRGTSSPIRKSHNEEVGVLPCYYHGPFRTVSTVICCAHQDIVEVGAFCDVCSSDRQVVERRENIEIHRVSPSWSVSSAAWNCAVDEVWCGISELSSPMVVVDLLPQARWADVSVATAPSKKLKGLIETFPLAPRVKAHCSPVPLDGNPASESTLPGRESCETWASERKTVVASLLDGVQGAVELLARCCRYLRLVIHVFGIL
eukprot:571954-Amphidinium_carterae.1